VGDQFSNLILFAAADCTGHGVPGAMVSVVCSNALNRAVKEFNLTEPGLILDKTRELVLETFARSEGEVKDGMDISLCALNTKTMELKWSGAHNPLWIISGEEEMSEEEIIISHSGSIKESSVPYAAKIQNQILKEIKPDKQHIGKTDNPLPFKTHSIQLKKEDLIFLFTDGFTDQFGGESSSAGKKYKSKRLKEILLKNAHLPIYQQKAELSRELATWKGDMEQTDDICVIGVRI
jgi:serine phosphatase RsbU (regulator of sigma subunit)